jgi:hypothetical protein
VSPQALRPVRTHYKPEFQWTKSPPQRYLPVLAITSKCKVSLDLHTIEVHSYPIIRSLSLSIMFQVQRINVKCVYHIICIFQPIGSSQYCQVIEIYLVNLLLPHSRAVKIN